MSSQEANLKTRYGITLAEYRKILREQHYRCAICNRPKNVFKKNLSVDHNHKTGKVRGLLCPYCNSRLLKYLRDDKKLVKGLIKYLTKALKEDKNWKEKK